MPEPTVVERRHLTLKLFGCEWPVPTWMLPLFGLVALVGAAGFVAKQVWPSAPELISLRQANHALSTAISEYNKHAFDTGEREDALIDDARGLLAVRVFDDACLLVKRRAGNSVHTKLIPDLLRQREHVDGDEIGEQYQSEMTGLMPVVHAAQRHPCQGRCLQFHPGPFESKYGQRNGCWIEVWRRFQDACEHVQLMNVCSGSFDSNPDGSPKVRWTCCRH